MSGRTDRLIPKLNDRDIVSAFQKVLSKFPDLALALSDGFGNVPVESIELIKKKASFNLTTATLSDRNVVWWTWTRLQDNASYDKLQTSWNNQNQPNRDRVIEISSALNSAFARPMADLLEDGSESPLPYSTQREVLLALEGAVAQLIQDTAGY